MYAYMIIYVHIHTQTMWMHNQSTIMFVWNLKPSNKDKTNNDGAHKDQQTRFCLDGGYIMGIYNENTHV